LKNDVKVPSKNNKQKNLNMSRIFNTAKPPWNNFLQAQLVAIFSSVHFSLDAGKKSIKKSKTMSYKLSGCKFTHFMVSGGFLLAAINAKNCYFETYKEAYIAFFLSNLRICGLEHKENLRICDCGMSRRICGLAICGQAHLRNLRI
jgi:hypothetical protein